MKSLSIRLMVALLTLTIGLFVNSLWLIIVEPVNVEPVARYYWIDSGEPINYERAGMVLVSEQDYKHAMAWREHFSRDPNYKKPGQ